MINEIVVYLSSKTFNKKHFAFEILREGIFIIPLPNMKIFFWTIRSCIIFNSLIKKKLW